MKSNFIILGVLLISFVSIAQDDELSNVTSEACICLEEVDVMLDKIQKYEEIKSCISTSIITNQLTSKLFGLHKIVNDTLNKIQDLSKIDTISITNDQEIIIDSNKNYRKIEDELLSNCPSMQRLMSNDDTQSELSVSEKKKALKFYDKGQNYFSQKKYENAVVEYGKAVRKDKKFAFAWDMLGYSYRMLNSFEEAIKSYDKSLSIDPKGRMPLMNKPIAYIYLEDYKNAIESYKDFIKVYPDDPEPYYGIGRAYHLIKDYENALDYTMKAFNMYIEINSPYARDAEKNLVLYYNELKEKNQLGLFKRLAEKHNINIE